MDFVLKNKKGLTDKISVGSDICIWADGVYQDDVTSVVIDGEKQTMAITQYLTEDYMEPEVEGVITLDVPWNTVRVADLGRCDINLTCDARKLPGLSETYLYLLGASHQSPTVVGGRISKDKLSQELTVTFGDHSVQVSDYLLLINARDVTTVDITSVADSEKVLAAFTENNCPFVIRVLDSTLFALSRLIWRYCKRS